MDDVIYKIIDKIDFTFLKEIPMFIYNLELTMFSLCENVFISQIYNKFY